MCIICNMGPDVERAKVASSFLERWADSYVAMRAAAQAMLAVSKIAPEAADRKKYDRMHKAMVREIRNWGRLEEIREREVMHRAG